MRWMCTRCHIEDTGDAHKSPDGDLYPAINGWSTVTYRREDDSGLKKFSPHAYCPECTKKFERVYTGDWNTKVEA